MENGGGTACNVNVAVRARPLLDFEDKSRCVDVHSDGTAQVGRNPGDDKHLLASSCPRLCPLAPALELCLRLRSLPCLLTWPALSAPTHAPMSTQP